MVDQRCVYALKEIIKSSKTFKVRLHKAKIETPAIMRAIERYYPSLRQGYETIRTNMDRQTAAYECLQIVLLSVSCTVRSEVFCPGLLVFGAISRPAQTNPPPSGLEQAKLVDRVRNEIAREQSRRKIAFGLKHKGGEIGQEHLSMLLRFAAESFVLFYQMTSM